MRSVSKQRFPVVGSLVVVLAVVVVSILLTSTTTRSAPQSTKSTQSSARIVSIDATFAHNYTSLGEMKGASTLIVLGTVTRQTMVIGNHGVPSTLSTLVIERTLKHTSATGQTIVIKQLGGFTPDGSHWIVENFPSLTIGTRYVMFLTPSLSLGVYYPVGAPEGIYPVSAGGAVNSFTTEASHMGIAIQNVALNVFLQHVQAAPNLLAQP